MEYQVVLQYTIVVFCLLGAYISVIAVDSRRLP